MTRLARLLLSCFVLLSSALLAACGGGEDSSHTSPQASRPLATAKAPLALAATFDANALFDWAAIAYPWIFEGQASQGTIDVAGYGTFLARGWSSTGNYVGVLADTVYVYGPVTNGQLLPVGSMESFRCRVTFCQPQVSFLDILHTAMVFDATGDKIYAYVPTGDAAHGGSFAIIDVATRQVQYVPVDFVPYRLAMAPDGRFLYASTATTSEVVRISLPAFTVDGRLGLGPLPPLDGRPEWANNYRAGSIAVSPVNSEIFAVSLVDASYGMCASGIRVYHNGTLKAELMDGSLGDLMKFDGDGQALTTTCTGTYPDIVTRVSYSGSALAVTGSERGEWGVPNSLDVVPGAVITGSVFNLPGLGLRGGLPPLSWYLNDDFARLLQSCVFASPQGTTAACISQTEDYPDMRAFVLYELTGANVLLKVPLGLPVDRASTILRLGNGRFAVGAGHNEDNPMWLNPFTYIMQNTRIYFLDGVRTSYPQ